MEAPLDILLHWLRNMNLLVGKAEKGYTGAGCCGLVAMAGTSGYDCVMIPAPSNKDGAMIQDRY